MSDEEGPSSVPFPRSASPPHLPFPELDCRWMHAGAQHLDLLPTPITTASTTYKSFSQDESIRIEEAWWGLAEAERRKAVMEWGISEGEGAPAKVNAKKKEAQPKEKERRGSGGSVNSVKSTHPIDEYANGDEGVPDHEVLRSGEEQAEANGDGVYKDLMQKAQKEYEDLELIAGVPVSQACCYIVSQREFDPVYRTLCSRSRCQPYPCTRSSGHIPVRGCRC